MRIATMNITRHVAGWLIALVIAIAGMGAGGSRPVEAKPSAAQSIQSTASFYCPGAWTYVSCTTVLTTSGYGTISMQVTNHANGGEVCQLTRPEQNGTFQPLTGAMWINYGDNGVKTFSPSSGGFLAGTKFVLRCKRRAPSGDAGIGGYVYYP